MQRLEREAEARGRAGHQVLHQHVGPGDELAQHLGRPRMLEVEREAFLRAVGPDEVRGQAGDALVVAAGEVAAAGPLELDHPGAEVGELAGAEGRGDRVLEREDGDAFERPHQNDRGRPSTCSATYDRIRLVEIGATW